MLGMEFLPHSADPASDPADLRALDAAPADTGHVLREFHPAVAGWFAARFAAPTQVQSLAWPAIRAGRHALVAAPTGSGKTLAAFLAALDDLVRRGIAGSLTDQTHVIYISPLKALSNDVERNLQEPLAGIRRELERRALPDADIRTFVRTGDTPARAREAMVRRPPHIVVTTPESLYILLTSRRGRELLRTARTVIVDEIHAVVGSKRGSHLSLSLERLDALAGRRLVRIGLSATQRPIETVARFLVGAGGAPEAAQPPDCTIIDAGHRRALDVAIEVPRSPLEIVMSGEVWEEIYDRLAELVEGHRTTLVFVNTRRLAERVTRHLAERLGSEHVTSHHGSLAREQRLDAEQRLKRGALRALVATSSLELGIDVGDVDLVCQLGATRSIAAFLQRVGRSGHALAAIPKGRIFPLSRDELVECAALLDAVRRGELDRLLVPEQPLDILAQQIVACVAAEEWSEDDLFALVRRAWPYRDLARSDFDAVVRMLAVGFATHRGRRSAHLHRDAVNRRLRARRGARIAAITCGGAIPDTADYQVVLEPGGTFIGTLNEDFAIESTAGDIFQLGNSSWRILRIEAGRVRVADARRRAADAAVLARRSARAERRALGRGLPSPRRDRGASRSGRHRRRRYGARLARERARDRARRRRAVGRVPRRVSCRARRPADAGDPRAGALLRRSRRHAARSARTVREPAQPRVGAGAAQAVLPQVQLRAAGGRDRGRHRAVARPDPQLPAGRSVRLPVPGDGTRGPRPGASGGADVRRALALEHDARARGAAIPQRHGRSRRTCCGCRPTTC